MHVCSNAQTWTNQTFNMAPYAGQTVRIEFLVHQDGFGDDTSMYVDDVTLGAGACGTPSPGASPTRTPTPTPVVTPTPGITPTPGCTPSGGLPGPWVAGTTGPPTRYRGGGATDGTNAYVFGGGTATATYLNDLWKWNAAAGTWTQLANMPTAKQNIKGVYYN